jgi:pimeloyl-ACP methyl ester carboxylesterase
MKHPHRIEHLIITSPAGVGHPAQVLRPFWWRAIAYLWECNLTPMDAIRWGGPFGRMISNYMLRGRARRSPPNSGFLNVIDLDALCEFGYENFAATASGERALALLLHPGAYGKKPIITFLRGGEGGFNSPVSIIYGDQRYDWMESKYGKQLRDQLVAQGVQCTVSEVRDAGHILFIDNPEGFNEAVVEAHKKMCGHS